MRGRVYYRRPKADHEQRQNTKKDTFCKALKILVPISSILSCNVLSTVRRVQRKKKQTNKKNYSYTLAHKQTAAYSGSAPDIELKRFFLQGPVLFLMSLFLENNYKIITSKSTDPRHNLQQKGLANNTKGNSCKMTTVCGRASKLLRYIQLLVTLLAEQHASIFVLPSAES